MTRFLAHRLLQTAILIGAISLVGFVILDKLPGGPLAAYSSNPEFREEDRARLAEQLGLDRPLPFRYVAWLERVAQGDLGTSLLTHQSVTAMIGARLGNTVQLMSWAFGLSVALAIPIGVLSAVRRRSRFDKAVLVFTSFGLSIPTFWLGLLLIALFAVGLRWLPPGGMGEPDAPPLVGGARHMLLPVATIVVVTVGLYARYVRAGILDTLSRDYVRTARAKGLAERTVVTRHVLRNGLAPFVTVAALHLPEVVTGAVVTETVFSWPGVGRLFWEAALRQDQPVLLGILLVGAVGVALSSLLADACYAWLNPRVRLA